jgi:SAM-dependent methyltransferase
MRRMAGQMPTSSASADDRVRALERECAELGRRLDVVYASRSWRLTAPLRLIAVWVRRLRVASRRVAPSRGEVGAGEAAGYPPATLRARVAGTADVDWFKESARTAIDDIEAALAANGTCLSEVARIYDFGCGCGRLTIPRVSRVGAERLTATDNDSAATAWLHARLPGVRVERSPTLPPLAYSDGEFDLIIGWSIFTHLPEDYQDAWLAELARVLGPGGVLLLTVSGATSFDVLGAAADDPVRNALPDEGFIYYDKNYGPDSPFEPYYQTAFHHPQYIRRHWSRWFEVVEIRAGAARPAQDMVVLRSRSPATADPAGTPRY